MTFQLNPEQERLVGEAIQAGLIRGVEDVVEAGVEAIRRRLEGRESNQAAADGDDWFRELAQWSHSHAETPLLGDEALDRGWIYGERE